MGKKMLSFILCSFILFAGSAQVLAAEPNTTSSNIAIFAISPRMDYIVQAKGSLYIDANGVATVSCSVYGYQDTAIRVEISANLQQYKSGRWVTLKTFTAESDSHRTSLNETHSISKGYRYRVQASIKAYSGSKSETRTVTSSEATY